MKVELMRSLGLFWMTKSKKSYPFRAETVWNSTSPQNAASQDMAIMSSSIMVNRFLVRFWR